MFVIVSRIISKIIINSFATTYNILCVLLLLLLTSMDASARVIIYYNSLVLDFDMGQNAEIATERNIIMFRPPPPAGANIILVPMIKISSTIADVIVARFCVR